MCMHNVSLETMKILENKSFIPNSYRWYCFCWGRQFGLVCSILAVLVLELMGQLGISWRELWDLLMLSELLVADRAKNLWPAPLILDRQLLSYCWDLTYAVHPDVGHFEQHSLGLHFCKNQKNFYREIWRLLLAVHESQIKETFNLPKEEEFPWNWPFFKKNFCC